MASTTPPRPSTADNSPGRPLELWGCVGLACLLSSSLLLPGSLIPIASTSGLAGSAARFCAVACAVGIAAACALGLLRGRRPLQAVTRLLSLLHPIGFALFSACALGLESPAWLLPAAAVATGAGGFALYLSWGALTSRIGHRGLVRMLAVALGSSSLIGMGLSALTAPVALAALCGLATCAAVVPLAGNHPRRPAEEQPVEPGTQTPPAPSASSLLNLATAPLGGLVVLTLVSWLLNQVEWLSPSYGASSIGHLGAAALLLFVYRGDRNRPLMYLAYQVVLPVIALALIVVRALAAELSFLVPLFDAGYWTLYGSVAVLSLAYLAPFCSPAEKTRLAPFAFAAFCAASCVGIAGNMLGETLGFPFEIVGLVIWMGYFALLAVFPALREWSRFEREVRGEPSPGDPGAFETGLERLKTSAALSPRESQVFNYLVRGHGCSFIAQTLFISESTVRTHTQNIYTKLGVSSREELLQIADSLRDARQER